MIRPLRRHPLRRQLSQLFIHQRQQFRGGMRIAMLEIGQDARYLVHRSRRSTVVYPQD
jgi:hypothetical protein